MRSLPVWFPGGLWSWEYCLWETQCNLEARIVFNIFHEMAQRCPLRSASRCTEASQLGYRVCDIDSHPCCCELELCHKRPIVLLFAMIRQHRYICRIEDNTRRDRHLLGAQHLLDVLLLKFLEHHSIVLFHLLLFECDPLLLYFRVYPLFTSFEGLLCFLLMKDVAKQHLRF